jgi:SAM-dependent methyltransferase
VIEAPRIFTPEYYEHMRRLEAHGWWNAAMRDIAARMLDGRLQRHGLILDAGCGSGQTLEWFSGLRPEWSRMGLDVAPEGLQAAAAAGHDALMRASVLDLPIDSASVDLVVSLDVLQHLPLDGGDIRALREFRRVLRPGGRLFVRTNAQAFPYTDDDTEAAFHKYRTGELRQRLRDAGYHVEVIGRLNALLGLAEIPREVRAARRTGSSGYQGILARPGTAGLLDRLKRGWLRQEGRLVEAGLSLPMGRTLIALCRTGKKD